MTISTQMAACYSVDCDKEIAHLLKAAKAKLLAEMPRQLRMVAYLRLCCSAMRKLHQKPSLSVKPAAKEALDGAYLPLLQALCKHNSEWWQQCWSSDLGILQSDQPVINKLLQPLERFIEVYAYVDSSN